ncbi:MAG TPA: GntR family transcriptional regulator [Streptosporangiaceae bacterium]|nr:GntR family transcriptional regulator [Streptosporangiaceae bacterium]
MGTTTEPVYLRVLEDLRSRIRSGLLGPGARIPSRNAIITNYGVGETAAKHALQVLATEGLIEARPGSGSYVRKVPAARFLEHDRLEFPGSPFGVQETVTISGDRTDEPVQTMARRLAWEHQTEQAPAPPRIAERLGLAGAAATMVTRYLLTSDGEPVQLAVSYEPAELTAGTAVAVPEQGPLAGRGVIERMRSIGVLVDEVVEELSVRPSLRAEASALAIPAGAAVLVIERVQYAAGRAVEVGEVVVPADRFKLRYRFPVAGPPC